MNQLSLDDAPRARVDDPESSHDAARSVSKVTEKRAAVLKVLREFGSLTDLDIALLYQQRKFAPQSPSGLRTRRSELVALGLVEWTGEWRKLATGRRARVWRAT